MSYFPILVNLENQKCLIVGGGKVALRKLKDLQAFDGDVTLVAPEISDEIRALAGDTTLGQPDAGNEQPKVLLLETTYEASGLRPEDFSLVIAATEDPALNHAICEECRAKRVLVNSADGPADSTFIVPAYVKQNHVVAAFSGGGDGPVIAQHLKRENEKIVTPWLGEVGEYLGSCRTQVKAQVKDPGKRKKVYEAILSEALTKHRLMSEDEIRALADDANSESEFTQISETGNRKSEES